MPHTDVLIVGAGPIGIELAAALKHAGVDYTHLDAGQIGQTITWYPRQARFFSSPERIAIAGVPLVTKDESKATREEYLAYLRGVVKQHELDIRTYQRVVGIDQTPNGFEVHTRKGGGVSELFHCQHLVLAIGDMHRPRLLHIPGEDLHTVSHYFEEPHKYFKQRLTIVGGKNSAAEAAIRCYRAGADVTLSYRGDTFNEKAIKYWLLPELKTLINSRQIRFFPKTVPTRITHESVILSPTDGGVPVDVPTDFTLLLTGYEQDPFLFDQLNLQRTGENQAPVLDPHTNQTSAKNVYIAGTAAAGTQSEFRLFIENCHPHVTRIVRAITGQAPPPDLVNTAAEDYRLPES